MLDRIHYLRSSKTLECTHAGNEEYGIHPSAQGLIQSELCGCVTEMQLPLGGHANLASLLFVICNGSRSGRGRSKAGEAFFEVVLPEKIGWAVEEGEAGEL